MKTLLIIILTILSINLRSQKLSKSKLIEKITYDFNNGMPYLIGKDFSYIVDNGINPDKVKNKEFINLRFSSYSVVYEADFKFLIDNCLNEENDQSELLRKTFVNGHKLSLSDYIMLVNLCYND